MSHRVRFFVVAALAVVVSCSLTLFLMTLLDHRLSGAVIGCLDAQVQTRVHAMTNPMLTDSMLALTWLGAIKVFGTALAGAVVWLAFRGRGREAVLLGGGVAGAFLLNETLKLHFHRVRPRVPWSIGDEHTFSFPSGHSLFAVVLYGTLAYLALQRGGSMTRRLGIVLPAALMPLGIGFSRIYLGMHYPTDVLAGWLAGALWLSAVLVTDMAGRGQARNGRNAQAGHNSQPPPRWR